MEEKKEKQSIGYLIVVLIIFAIIVIVPLLNNISESQKKLEEAKHEGELIKEGKTISDSKITQFLIDDLQNNRIEKSKEYFDTNFTYIDDKNNKYNNPEQLIQDVKPITQGYHIEQRKNELENQETFFLYWNVPVENIKNYIEHNDQVLKIYLEKIIEKDRIYYKINKIILTNN